MVKLLVILQNAYGDTPRRRRQLENHELWLQGLWASHTGTRLRSMLPDECAVTVINASPQIGDHAGAAFPPDVAHIQAAVATHRPDVVLACGRYAQMGAIQAGVQHLAAPHPAWRALTKEHAAGVRERVATQLGV